MTIIHQDRTDLDRALGLPYPPDNEVDPDSEANVVLLLAGDENSPAHAIYIAALEAIFKSWYKVYLITDLTVLEVSEQSRWVDEVDQFAIYVVDGDNSVKRGNVSELQLSSGEASLSNIIEAFEDGELA